MRRLAAALLGLLGAGSAVAAPPAFNYLDIDWVQLEGESASWEGYGLTLSSPLPGSSNYMHLRYAKLDPEGVGDELERIRAGLGHIAGSPGGPAFYTLVSFERNDAAVRDEGYGGEFGIRLSIGDRFDLGAGARYVDFDNSGNDTGWNAALAVGFSPGFSLYGRYERLFDTDEIRLGVRLTNP